jgi:beta-glucosidase/6-phospho-beta-glucosidase/beta-galactosidase
VGRFFWKVRTESFKMQPPINNEFLWGVASSGYQCEGGYNGPGQPQNNWTDVEARGRVMRTGLAADFWNRYQEDFAHCHAMGLNAFRLSIEWARVQPSTSAKRSEPPAFDFGVLDGYADRLAACRRQGLEPVITLQHFNHPAWAGRVARRLTPAPEQFVSTTAASTPLMETMVNCLCIGSSLSTSQICW